LKVRNFGDFFALGKYFEHIVLAGDDPMVEHNKPHPDPYLVCIDRFHPKPDAARVLVFEDSPTGVKSAVSAGLKCVMTPDPRLDRSKCLEATLVLDSLAMFEPQLFGLPKYD
jgi:pseudouridine-5'-monophosphatase